MSGKDFLIVLAVIIIAVLMFDLGNDSGYEAGYIRGQLDTDIAHKKVHESMIKIGVLEWCKVYEDAYNNGTLDELNKKE